MVCFVDDIDDILTSEMSVYLVLHFTNNFSINI